MLVFIIHFSFFLYPSLLFAPNFCFRLYFHSLLSTCLSPFLQFFVVLKCLFIHVVSSRVLRVPLLLILCLLLRLPLPFLLHLCLLFLSTCSSSFSFSLSSCSAFSFYSYHTSFFYSLPFLPFLLLPSIHLLRLPLLLILRLRLPFLLHLFHLFSFSSLSSSSPSSSYFCSSSPLFRILLLVFIPPLLPLFFSLSSSCYYFPSSSSSTWFFFSSSFSSCFLVSCLHQHLLDNQRLTVFLKHLKFACLIKCLTVWSLRNQLKPLKFYLQYVDIYGYPALGVKWKYLVPAEGDVSATEYFNVTNWGPCSQTCAGGIYFYNIFFYILYYYYYNCY